MARRVLVAEIGAAHGLRGEVRLWSFTEDPMAVKDYGRLEDEDGTRTFEIEGLKPAKDFLIARLAGICDRTATEALRGVQLYVPRERLPAPEDENTFYHADLIGLDAVTAAGRRLGRVVAVRNFGAGDLIEVEPADGGVSVLLPFTAAAVPRIDLPAGRLVLDPPAGLIEENVSDAAEEGRRQSRRGGAARPKRRSGSRIAPAGMGRGRHAPVPGED